MESRSREKTAIKEPNEEQAKKNSSISQLPFVILVNILSRLPLKTIYRCRCVCKSWFNLFSDPYFVETHFKLAPTCLLLQPFIVGLKRKPNPYMVDWQIPNVCDDAIVKFDPNVIPSSNNCTMVNSCNGLLCLWCPLLRAAYCVCNPISGEYVLIPPVEDYIRASLIISSFGFSPVSDRYKIVRFSCVINFHDLTRTWEAVIFTIGADSVWRSIGESFKPPSGQGQPADTFLNGRIHWVVSDCDISEFICCFDFNCEGFQSVSPPLEFKAEDLKRTKWMSLGVMGGCLCICDYSVDNYIVIWMMLEYGVQESWTKKFVISAPITCTARLKNSSSKIRFLDNGKFLIFFNRGVLVSYNMEQKEFMEIEVDRIQPKIDGANAHKPSFVLLKEIAMRQNWKSFDVRRRIW